VFLYCLVIWSVRTRVITKLTLEQPGASIDANIHYWTVSFEQMLPKKSPKIWLCLTLCSLSKNKCKKLF